MDVNGDGRLSNVEFQAVAEIVADELVKSAVDAARSGRTEAAIQHLQKAVSLDPENGAANMHMASLLTRAHGLQNVSGAEEDAARPEMAPGSSAGAPLPRMTGSPETMPTSDQAQIARQVLQHVAIALKAEPPERAVASLERLKTMCERVLARYASAQSALRSDRSSAEGVLETGAGGKGPSESDQAKAAGSEPESSGMGGLTLEEAIAFVEDETVVPYDGPSAEPVASASGGGAGKKKPVPSGAIGKSPAALGYTDVYEYVHDALRLYSKKFRNPDPQETYSSVGGSMARAGKLLEALPYFAAHVYHQPYLAIPWRNLALALAHLAQQAGQVSSSDQVTLLRMSLQAADAALVIEPGDDDTLQRISSAQVQLEGLGECGHVPGNMGAVGSWGQCRRFPGSTAAGGRQTHGSSHGRGGGRPGAGKGKEGSQDVLNGGIANVLERLARSENDRVATVAEFCTETQVRLAASTREIEEQRLHPSTLIRAIAVVHVCGAVVLERIYPDELIRDVAAAQRHAFSAHLKLIKRNPRATNSTLASQRSPLRHELRAPMEDPYVRADLVLQPLLRPVLLGMLGDRVELDTFSSVTSLPTAPDQHWHRDLPRLFEKGRHGYGNHLPPHGLVAFVTLVNVTDAMGPTEVLPGSHVSSPDDGALFAAARTLRFPAPAGSAVLFDIRILHRGTGNRSGHQRPQMYLAYVRDFFVDRINFHEKHSRALDGIADNRVRKVLLRVDERRYMDLLEAELVRLGAKTNDFESTYPFKTSKLTIGDIAVRIAGEVS
jgi:tetratricopeptide (TPR) repeat protein